MPIWIKDYAPSFIAMYVPFQAMQDRKSMEKQNIHGSGHDCFNSHTIAGMCIKIESNTHTLLPEYAVLNRQMFYE